MPLLDQMCQKMKSKVLIYFLEVIQVMKVYALLKTISKNNTNAYLSNSMRWKNDASFLFIAIFQDKQQFGRIKSVN